MALKSASPEKKEAAKLRLRLWRAANRDHVNAKHREYVRQHPVIRERQRIRRDEGCPPGPGKPDTFPCKKCGEVKPFTREFFQPHFDNKWRLSYRCRVCSNAYSRVNAAAWRYKISREDVAALRAIKHCALCGSSESLNIDHCHASGKVRDVLCAMCNSGLGSFRDNVEVMRKAILYLETHK